MPKIKSFDFTNIAELRAAKIIKLRKYTGLSRQDFAVKYEKFGITRSALENWEIARWNGLTERGAERLEQAFREEGFPVTKQWLLYGNIDEDIFSRTVRFKQELLPQEAVIEELRFFHELNSNSVDTVITDDGMAPWLVPGDYVAGKRFIGSEIDSIVNLPCILQLQSGQILVRILKKGRELRSYDLISCNKYLEQSEELLENVELISAAPILWVRKIKYSHQNLFV